MNNERGSILVVTLGYILVFTLLGLSAMYLAMTQNEAADKDIASTKAFWLAEAGLQKGLWEARQNNCHNFVQAGTSTSCTSCTTCGTGNKTLALTVANYGDYDIVINELNTTLNSTGSYPSRTDVNRKQRQVKLDTGSLFKFAAFAKEKVKVGNNLTVDAYNSSNGAYSLSNKSENGDIGSNSSAADAIQLNNNSVVKGNVSTGVGGIALCGSGGGATPCTTPSSYIPAGQITHTNNVSLADVTVPSSLTSLSSESALTVSGTATLTGNHKYSSVNLTNGSTLNISGDVSLYLTSSSALTTGTNGITVNIPVGSKLTVYTDGVVTFGNNAYINNASQIASNLKFFSTYTSANGVTINNSNQQGTSAAVYAPNTDVTINNNGDFAGAVVGKTVTLAGSNNSFVHFDEALGGSIQNTALVWSEL